MALTDKLVCQIAGVFLAQDINGILDPQAGSVIVAQADTGPLAVLQQSGAWQDYIKAPHVNALCSANGSWQLGIPAQTDCSPPTVKWSISRPDGAVWFGSVTSAMVSASQSTPLTIKNLVDTYGWGLVPSTSVPVVAIQGPQGIQGIQGIPGVSGTSAITTKGDLVVGSATGATVRLPVGADGSLLLTDSTQANGVRWGGVPLATLSAIGGVHLLEYDAVALGLIPDGGASDQTNAFNAALQTAAGGTLVLPQGKIKCLGQIVNPANGGTGAQTLRIRGQGTTRSGSGGGPNGGTILDLRYAGTDAKLLTTSYGCLEIDGVTFVDGGTDTLPFIKTTRTTLLLHDNEFQGTGVGAASLQDAIILGGTENLIDATPNSQFVGYGTVIRENYFNHVQRAVLLQTYANSPVICHNTVWSGGGGVAAFDCEPVLTGDNNAGGAIFGNLIEMTNYTYGIKVKATKGMVLSGNNMHDWGVGITQAYYRFEADAPENFVIAGVLDASKTLVSDANGSNTILTPYAATGWQVHVPSTFSAPSGGNSSALTVRQSASNNIGLIIQGAALSQQPLTSDPFVLRDSGGNVLLSLGRDGNADMRASFRTATGEFFFLTGLGGLNLNSDTSATVTIGNGGGILQAFAATTLRPTDAATTTITDSLIVGHATSGTPAAGYGTGIKLTAYSSTKTIRDAARIAALWTTATDASQAADLVFSTVAAGGALTEGARLTSAGLLTATAIDAPKLSGLVPLPALAGLTTAQLSAAAGIVGSQLSATAGIVSGQIASVNPSALTGTGTIPPAALPAHAATHAPGGSDDTNALLGIMSGTRPETIARTSCAGITGSLTVGTGFLTYFVPQVTRNVTTLYLATGGTVPGTGATNVYVSIYAASANGQLTSIVLAQTDLLAGAIMSPNNDFSTGSALYMATIASTTLTAGTRYCFAFLQVGGTAPRLTGSLGNSSLLGNTSLLPVGAMQTGTGLTTLPTALPYTPPSPGSQLVWAGFA